MRGIFLVGFMGAGKSSVGRELANRLGRGFIDLDQRLCDGFGSTIAEVFQQQGETEFRTAESKELACIAGLEDVVVATGGGAFCSEHNREIIRSAGGVSVYLDLPWKTLHERLLRESEERPLFISADQAKELFESRLPSYRQASIRVSLHGGEALDAVVESVVEAVQEAPCAI